MHPLRKAQDYRDRQHHRARICLPWVREGMKVNIGKDEAKFIDHLRDAAKEFGAVSELLDAIHESISIDDATGILMIVADETDKSIFHLAKLAAAFSGLDRGES